MDGVCRSVLVQASASVNIFVSKLDETVPLLFKAMDDADVSEPAKRSIAHAVGHLLALCATSMPPQSMVGSKKDKKVKVNSLPAGLARRSHVIHDNSNTAV